MRTTLRLAAVLLAGLALPALAQTPAPATRTAPTSAPASRAAAPSATAPAPAPAASTKVDINSATEAQLDALPGIGPVRAKAIIAGRPWDDLDALVKKGAVPQNVLNGARAQMALANINTSSAGDMAKTLPGIGDARAKAIVAGRAYGAPQDLVTKKVLTQAAFDKVKDLIAF